MPKNAVNYKLDDGTTVTIEVEPNDEQFREVTSGDTATRQVREAVGPALEGARAVLDKARELAPDEVQVSFGIKVSGTANWWIAKAATEGNFAITMTWRADGGGAGD